MPKRYIVKCEWGYEHDTIEDDEGRFVLWEDYKELLAENDRLRGEVAAVCAQLQRTNHLSFMGRDFSHFVRGY